MLSNYTMKEATNKEEAIISSRKVLKFTPSSLFKKKIND